MTEQQVQMRLAQLAATFYTTKNGVAWWKLPDGRWVGVMRQANGLYDVRTFEKNCNC